jgi:hypothetical protein
MLFINTHLQIFVLCCVSVCWRSCKTFHEIMLTKSFTLMYSVKAYFLEHCAYMSISCVELPFPATPVKFVFQRQNVYQSNKTLEVLLHCFLLHM